MSCPLSISEVKDIFLAIAAVVTASCAVIGLRSWSRELKGKAEFDVARSLIRTTYRLRDEIAYCRSPLIRGGEFPEGYSNFPSGNSSLEETAQAWAHVFNNRWKPVQSALQELESEALEAEALWGTEIKEKLFALRRCAHELHVGIESFVNDKFEGGENFKHAPEFGEQTKNTIYAHKTDDNPFTTKISSCVDDIESVLRPHLKRS